ncbi:MAG: sn-glycerol-3-phosphate ABC transporter ATP-binding protein UgpC [Burkholderiales bacterium]|nr:sn-glycerol-3-phosphate ABC transporter ATP-binding protein UgpC [Burkholderiales bacterium]
MASVELHSVHKQYGDAPPVLREVDLAVAEGEFFVFIGPSGCGKSTLLRMVAGLEDISGGEIRIAGQRVNETPPARRGVAMVFQSYALFPHMTVRENLSFGMTINGVAKDVIAAKVADAARMLQLEPLLDRKPRQLSGGQRQRVAIGRAIVREPGVFLFDEPLSNLDAALRTQTRFEIARLHRRWGRASSIYVTHDQVEAMTLADRILLLHSGEDVARHGSVAQVGTPLELYHRPRSLFVAGFIGSPKMNFMPGTLVEAAADRATVRLAGGETLHAAVDARRLAAGAPVTLGVRPEHLLPAAGTGTDAIVREVQWQERLGDATYLYVEGASAGAPWVAKAPGAASAKPGQRVAFAPAPTAIHLFDDAGLALPRCIDETELELPVPASPA